eukprot:CAMPEP_0115538156 /NCGR_PEP_ID=MMETSP0271-20121206/88721_1 /TAXON_ID=71861 /ORGANISM="Scrippsiella trochoidea, Strain CCMP3099" /LENGTH=141 /DNA_ID=CAMNT_0002971019 /DNA_START=137 /DNA_END=558 /DNA_ORIENTATION=-
MADSLASATGLTRVRNNTLDSVQDLGHARFWLNFEHAVEVAKFNFDHFGPCLQTVYAVGHRMALEKAYQGGKQRHAGKLQMAYAMNAFADHMLSDMFAAGHIRTPRVEIGKSCVREGTGSLDVHILSAALTAQQMHEEDGR